MKEISNKKYLHAIFRALYNYLKANGKRIISISEITGQKYVLISFYGLYRYHDITTGYYKFMDAWNEGIKDDLLNLLKRISIRVIRENNNNYLQVSLQLLKELIYFIDSYDTFLNVLLKKLKG